MREAIFLSIKSVADWSAPSLMREVGDVFDSYRELRIDRWAWDDPGNARLDGPVAAKLAEWAPNFATRNDNYLALGRAEGDGAASPWAEFTSAPGWAGMDVPEWLLGQFEHHLMVSVDAEWAEDGHLDLVGELFSKLCAATDAFYGYAVRTDVERQRYELHGKGKDEGLIPWPDLDPKTPYYWLSIFLPDVFWLNYFGPAFVDRWGTDRIERVGVRRDWTPNGGVVVWATDTPTHLEAITRMDDPQWKRAFYDVLGTDTFEHEGITLGEPGEHVPLFAEHHAAIRQHPSDGLAAR